MSRQEPEQWQPETQYFEEPGRTEARLSGPLGSLDREIDTVSQAPLAAQPATANARVIGSGVTRIVLAAGGMALSIVGLVWGILTLALRHDAAPLGITLIVLSALGLLTCIAALVFAIVSLALRVGRVRGRFARVRGVRWPPRQP